MTPELILGGIGTFTGVLALGIHAYKEFFKEKADLKIKYFTYKLRETKNPVWNDKEKKQDYETIGIFHSNILFKNKGNKNTTVNKINFDINGYLIELKETMAFCKIPFDIKANSSYELDIKETFDFNQFENIQRYVKKQTPVKFGVHVWHTYGKIDKYKELQDFS